jgi:D-beta-D-heptose 7-phosphate kinase/D-beta-D-heptose 1-phosphate adenosyltransferase
MLKDTQQQKQFKILVVGDACLDVYYFGTCDRLSPEAPVPVFKRSNIKTVQGMCLNVAANLRALGNNVNVHRNTEKIRKIRLVDSRSGQHILRVDEEPEIKNIDVREYSRKSLAAFDALVISDYDKGFIGPGDILDIIEPARFLGIPIFVDSKKKDLSSFEGCIIKVNEKEENKIKKLPVRYELIVTRGAEGCVWRGTNFPTRKVDVHDVCGAGDVFLASLTHMYLASKGNMKKSINFANSCAATSVEHFGTWVINQNEIA